MDWLNMILWCLRSEPVKQCIYIIVMYYQPISDLIVLSLNIATYKALRKRVFLYIDKCWKINDNNLHS